VRITVVPGLVDLRQELPHRAPDLDVDARGGLVQDQQLRLVDHGARDHQAPLHAARERARRLERLVPDLQLLEVALGALDRDPARDAVEAGLVHADVERLLELVEVDLLRHQPDQRQRRLALAHQVVPEHADGARAHVDERGDDADQRRLAGAVGAQERKEVARLDRERDALEGHDAVAVGLAQVLDFQRRRRHPHRVPKEGRVVYAARSRDPAPGAGSGQVSTQEREA
jgi:hypothetical protein